MSDQSNAPQAPSVDVKDVIANAFKYGFKWVYTKLHRGEGSPKKLLRENAPMIELGSDEDSIRKFVVAFGAAKLASMINGTSLRVKIQATSRPAIEANNAITNDALKERIVRHVLLGQVSRTVNVGAPLYTLPDGKTTRDQEVARKAWREANQPMQLSDDDKAREMIEMLTEAGVDVAVAMEKARAKYPNASWGEVSDEEQDEIDARDHEGLDEA